jgi:cystathionine beta-lyase family protein involved in aluminum resistance
MRPAAAKQSRDFGAELSCAKVIVENCYVDFVEELSRLFDRSGRDALVTMLAEDGGSKVKIVGFVVKQENANRLRVRIRHQAKRGWGGLGRLDHRLTSL